MITATSARPTRCWPWNWPNNRESCTTAIWLCWQARAWASPGAQLRCAGGQIRLQRRMGSVSKTIVFVHGAWMTPLCWEKMLGYFEGKGYTCLAPAWPHKDVPIEELRKNPQALAGPGVTEIVDHYERIIRGLNEPPILIGHSFGGLFIQMLLDRGVGVAGVAIDPAPPRGVLPMGTAWTSNAWILFTWRGWKKVLYSSFDAFRYAFVHTLPEAEQRAIYERYVVPETGRIFFQAGFALMDPRQAVRVNFRNPTRGP